MPQIEPVTLDTAQPRAAETLNAVKAKLGMVPNLFSTLGHSPVALNGYVQLNETLTQGRLNAQQREIVALAVGQENACQYCLSAHSLMGRKAGLSDEQIQQARKGSGVDDLNAAVAGFAQLVVKSRGQLPAGSLQLFRRAGLDDELMLEIIAHVALNVLTNYTNHIAETEVDFPAVNV